MTPATKTAPERLLSVREAADFLRIGERTIRESLVRPATAKGSIPHFELPSHGRRRVIKFSPEVLTRWLEMGCPPAADFRRIDAASRKGGAR